MQNTNLTVKCNKCGWSVIMRPDPYIRIMGDNKVLMMPQIACCKCFSWLQWEIRRRDMRAVVNVQGE